MTERTDTTPIITETPGPSGVCQLLGTITLHVYCRACPASGRPNEDAVAIWPIGERQGVVAIADGFGGQPAGDQASRLALQALGDAVAQSARAGGDLRAGILNGFDEANRAVQSIGVGAATTLTTVEIADQTVRIYHVGDSVAMIIGQRGKLKYQTIPHSPVGYAVEAGMLGEEEAMHHHDRHFVSNAVGSDEMRIDIGPTLRLAARDTLVLGSDGLFDNLHQSEIIEFARAGPLDRAMNRLVTLAIERMTDPKPDAPSKPDDLSIVLARLA